MFEKGSEVSSFSKVSMFPAQHWSMDKFPCYHFNECTFENNAFTECISSFISKTDRSYEYLGCLK